ncbi:MAG: NUDIX domain-containing protein [Candidatus Jorgensenbacteria bacterium]|nr:NUDIX domain-containing protein [Candidatus Jorgensenbacteria bacterium]
MENSEKRIGVGCGVMILKEGKVLLGLRHPNHEKAGSALRGEGTWTMPGGKLRYGETFEECAARETMEETGITLRETKVISVRNDKNEHAHFVTIGLLCEKFDGEPEVREPDKMTEWRWFGLEELPTPLFFPSARVIESYRAGEFYGQ